MATDHFCLIWNNFQNSILSALGNLQTCQDLVDVTLMCEGQNVKAHKVILSACSPYFRNLFKEHPCQHPIIILKDVTHSDLTALLQFMYQGEVMVSQDNLASFLKTAELLQISGLTGSQQSSNPNSDQSQRTEKRPKPLPDTNLGKPPDIQETVNDKLSSEVSFKKQKRDRDTRNEKEIVNREDKSFDIESDPLQSCSYDSSSPIVIKTESLDKDYDEMDTEPGDVEQYDNNSSQLEEPSILERSLKAQSGPHSTKQYMDLSISSVNLEQAKQIISDKRKMGTDVDPPIVKKVYKNVVTSDSNKGDELHESTPHGWNQSQEGLCPHCNKTYSNQSALKYHVRLVHSDLLHMFFCHLCPESFKYREHYKAHMWDMHNVRN